jgi:tetratricopeptide (TPR) repeat protein
MKKVLFALTMFFLVLNSYGQQSKADTIAKDEDASRLASYLLHIMGGIKFKRNGDYEKAFDSYDSAISIDPDYPEVYYHIGKLFFERENNLKSVENLSKAIDLGRKDFKVFLLRGMVKYNLGDYRGSDLDYLRAFEVANTKSSFFQVSEGGNDAVDDKNFSDLFLKMGMNKTQLQDYARAIEDYNKALFYDEKNSKALFLRGAIRVQYNAVNDGCLDLSRAGELGNEMAYDFIKKYCN